MRPGRIGNAVSWDEEVRATAHAVAAIVATQIRHANDLAKLAERQTGFRRDLTEIERSHAALADQTERLNCEHWDLLVTVLDMPGMSGLELIGSLRQVAPALLVVVVTAYAPAAVAAALLSHADGYLEKPLRVDRLIATATALITQGPRRAFGVEPGLQG